MDDEENKPAIAQMQSQLSELQKLVELQAQTMNLQTQLLQSSRSVPAMSSHHVRQVKCPEGHYNMTPAPGGGTWVLTVTLCAAPKGVIFSSSKYL